VNKLQNNINSIGVIRYILHGAPFIQPFASVLCDARCALRRMCILPTPLHLQKTWQMGSGKSLWLSYIDQKRHN
jgi:hypothetical protein